jgi:hypothetical protein
MATNLTVRSLIRSLGLPIGTVPLPLPRRLVPSYEVHDKRAKMYHPSMHRLSLRREMQRW